jgi:hypothetical protein
MQYHLIIQPFDCDYDFLEDICRNSKSLYKIKMVEILSRKMLPEYLLLSPKSLLAKFFMRKRRMIYLNDLLEELKKHFPCDSKKMILAILPHFILGFGGDLAGLTLEPNLSIVSTYGINERYLSKACVGISLHEIGHNLGLRHCRSEGCLMKAPCKPKNFYKGVYRLCKEHEKMLAASLALFRSNP